MCCRATIYLCHSVLYARYSTLSSASVVTSHRTRSINNGNADLMSLGAMVTGVWLTQSHKGVIYKVFFNLYMSWMTLSCGLDSSVLLFTIFPISYFALFCVWFVWETCSLYHRMMWYWRGNLSLHSVWVWDVSLTQACISGFLLFWTRRI